MPNRSAREIDIDPRTFVGLQLPLKSDGNNNFASTKTSTEQAGFNLKNLLLTSLRERVSNPTFGSRLRELCFEQIDENLPEKIEGEVRKATSTWLPYININTVETLTKNGDKSKIVVAISFSTTLEPETTNELKIEPA